MNEPVALTAAVTPSAPRSILDAPPGNIQASASIWI